jgi:hypothetical protein
MEQAFDKCSMEILPDFWTGVDRQEYNKRFEEKKI